MQRTKRFLHRVHTWTAIALLALGGWLIDSLVWFLREHALTLAGFATYLSHAWYALPILAAMLIIVRLRHPSELLALTIYDQRGVPVRHQGAFQLDEAVLGPVLASFRGEVQENGLHRIDLPSGATAYFLRQGTLTLVACFSGPPRPAQLEDQLRVLRQQDLPAEDLLCGLPPDVAALAAGLLNLPVERDLLIYLWVNHRVAMTAADLAWQIGYAQDEVTAALENLIQSKLVRSQCVEQMTFYRLTDDQVWLARLAKLIAWRVDWLAHARRVEQLVGARLPATTSLAD
jgi:DNA-binding transcriptional ArsR family regulator